MIVGFACSLFACTFMQAGIVLLIFQPTCLAQRLSIMPNTNPTGTNVIGWSSRLSLWHHRCFSAAFLCPKDWGWMLRVGRNGLFTRAFISSEGKAKTFNKTFTTGQMSVSLHPHFPPPVTLYRDALHFPRPFYFFPPYTPFDHADNKGWSFGCPREWGLLSVFWWLLVKKAFPP